MKKALREFWTWFERNRSNVFFVVSIIALLVFCFGAPIYLTQRRALVDGINCKFSGIRAAMKEDPCYLLIVDKSGKVIPINYGGHYMTTAPALPHAPVIKREKDKE